MLRLVSDENFHGDVPRGLYRRRPELDIVRVQVVGLSATSDPDILAWAAAEGRIPLGGKGTFRIVPPGTHVELQLWQSDLWSAYWTGSVGTSGHAHRFTEARLHPPQG
jgi:hypothetical protein